MTSAPLLGEIHDYEVLNSSLAMCGYCDTSEFVAIAESLTGRTATGYDGCYHATEFAYVPATP